jgi:hypothetical protein
MSNDDPDSGNNEPLMSQSGQRPSSFTHEGGETLKNPKTRTAEYDVIHWRRRLSSAAKDWKVEIGFCFLAVASLAAIVGTLLPYQGQPLPKWPYDLSINALISLYVIILKTTILAVLCQGMTYLLCVANS